MASLPQSLQETFRKCFAIVFNSLVDQFEFLCTLAWCVMRLAGFGAAEEDVHSLGWLFTTVWFRTWETSVTSHDSAETSLTPAKFGCALLLYALHCVHGMLTSRGTVPLHLTRHFHHKSTLSIRPTRVGYLGMPHWALAQIMPLRIKFRVELIR